MRVPLTGAAVVAVVLASAAAASGESAEGWKAPDVQRQLKLTPAQVASLDRIFYENLLERRRLRAQLDLREVRLVEAMAAEDVDEGLVHVLIDELEETRARRNILRSLMLLKMHGVLSPNQRALLKLRARHPD